MNRVWVLGLLAAPMISAPSATVHVVNRSQYEVLELRVHPAPRYLEADDLLEAPLPIDQTIDRDLAPGESYVTFFRERYLHGPVIALTMSQPIELSQGGEYELTIFDESFRIEALYVPTSSAAGCDCNDVRQQRRD